MKHYRYARLALAGLTLIAAAGCAFPISRQLRIEARNAPRFTDVLENPAAHKGTTVIWGGKILRLVYEAGGTEIIILETPLDYYEAPYDAQYTRGRFLARAARFLDPEVYRRGEMVTVAGVVVGQETRPLGRGKYTYPVISIKEIHLWPAERYVYPPPYYGWSWYWNRPHYFPDFDGEYTEDWDWSYDRIKREQEAEQEEMR